MELTKLLQCLEEIAPIELSHAFIEQGGYDNSGLIVKSHDNVEKVVFALDLTTSVVERAISLKADTIITHHPAIYNPIKNIGLSEESKALQKAIQQKMNVISMHLNLDIAVNGIDVNLAKGLGCNEYEIINKIKGDLGYGKKFSIPKIKLKDYVEKIKQEFETDKILYYGNKDSEIENVASYCGAGGGEAVENIDILVDVVVSSDIAHHQLKSLLENQKSVIVIPHYVAERYGYKKFYEQVNNVLFEEIEAIYVDDLKYM